MINFETLRKDFESVEEFRKGERIEVKIHIPTLEFKEYVAKVAELYNIESKYISVGDTVTLTRNVI